MQMTVIFWRVLREREQLQSGEFGHTSNNSMDNRSYGQFSSANVRNHVHVDVLGRSQENFVKNRSWGSLIDTKANSFLEEPKGHPPKGHREEMKIQIS